MTKVDYNEKNFDECRCPTCPVEKASECAAKRLAEEEGSSGLPATGQTAREYCAAGQTTCGGFNYDNPCQCPTCPVWDEYDLHRMYFCEYGKVEKIEAED